MESRLPKFIDSSGRLSPKGYTARVELYGSPDTARVIIIDPQHRTVFDQRGSLRWRLVMGELCRIIRHLGSGNPARLRLFEPSLVPVHLDHVASFIVNANHSIMEATLYISALGNSLFSITLPSEAFLHS